MTARVWKIQQDGASSNKLRTVDAGLRGLEKDGCVAHGNFQSSTWLLCPPEFQGWDTPYAHDTVTLLSQDPGATALGSACGSGSRCVLATKCARRLPVLIMPTEMVLTRQCAEVSELRYHMHINGDLVDHELLASVDGQLRASVSASFLW